MPEGYQIAGRRSDEAQVQLRLFEGDDRYERAQIWINGWQVPPEMNMRLEVDRDVYQFLGDDSVVQSSGGPMRCTVTASITVDYWDVQVLPSHSDGVTEQDGLAFREVTGDAEWISP